MKRFTVVAALVVLSWVGVPSQGDARPEDQLADADRLWREGKFDECFAALHEVHKVLPDDARLSRWEIPFDRVCIQRAAIGKKHVYFMYLVGNSGPDAPGLRSALESVDIFDSRSQWVSVVVCVDGGTGKILWSRTVTGYGLLAVDPVTDSAFLLHNNAIELDADTGRVLARHHLGKMEKRTPGLMLGGGAVVLNPPVDLEGDGPRKVSLFVPRTGRTMELDLRSLRLMSGDERRQLVWHRNPEASLDCFSVEPPGAKLWTFVPGADHAGIDPPVWFEGDVLWLTGSGPGRAEVVRIAGDTGKPLWRTVMPRGGYRFERSPMAGFNKEGGESPLIALKDRLLVVDESGAMSLLDPADGRLLGSTWAAREHVCPPAQIGETLIVCSSRSLRAIPMKRLLGPSGPDERTILTRKARCLVSLGKAEEARSMMDEVLRRDEGFADAWLERAEACRALGEGLDEAFSRCRGLALLGKVEDPRLREQWGMLRLLPLDSPPAWQFIQVAPSLGDANPRLLVRTKAGDVWSIDTRSLEYRRLTQAEASMFPTGAQKTPNFDEPLVGDAAWNTWMGYDGRPVRYRDKFYRPLKDGRVRVFDGAKSREFASPLTGITSWQIHLSPEGPLGYGVGGVYELDENLCPVRTIIGPPDAGKAPDQFQVMFLRSTADSLGLVVASRQGAFLRVYTRDGRRLLNQVPVGRFTSGWLNPRHLIVLGDGYLFSDRQLTWAGALPGLTWQFGPPLERQQDGLASDLRQYFGEPATVDGRVFVTALDGCVYVFDAGRITRSTPPPGEPPR